jgi:hypothetical protein
MRIATFLVVPLLAIASIALVSCSEDDGTSSGTTRADIENELRDARTKTDSQIAELQGKLTAATGDTREKLQQQIDENKTLRDDINRKLDEVQGMTDTNWDSARDSVKDATDKLTRRLDDLESKARDLLDGA